MFSPDSPAPSDTQKHAAFLRFVLPQPGIGNQILATHNAGIRELIHCLQGILVWIGLRHASNISVLCRQIKALAVGGGLVTDWTSKIIEETRFPIGYWPRNNGNKLPSLLSAFIQLSLFLIQFPFCLKSAN